jgi:hypothetical protein
LADLNSTVEAGFWERKLEGFRRCFWETEKKRYLWRWKITRLSEARTQGLYHYSSDLSEGFLCLNTKRYIQSSARILGLLVYTTGDKMQQTAGKTAQKVSERYNDYMRDYLHDHFKRISINLHIEKDRDILEALDDGNIQGSIKKLIRKAIAQ